MAGMLSTTGMAPLRSMGVSPYIANPSAAIHTKVTNSLGMRDNVSNPWNFFDSQYAKAAEYEDSQRKIREQNAKQQALGSNGTTSTASAADTLLGS